MKVLLWGLFAFLAFFGGAFNTADATHLAGGQVTYTHIVGNTYNVKLAIYRDCSGISLQSTQSMRLNPTNSGTTFTVTRTSITDITPVCPGQTSVCAGGTTPGREEHIYEGNVTLNALPLGQSYTISWESCCRNGAITTLNSPGSTGFYLATQLDPNQLQKNTSPVFLNPPIATLCAGQPATISPNAVDANGDALVYSLTTCLDQGAIPVSYAAGYSATAPISTTAGLNLNASTGALTFTPSQAGEVGVICLKVEEFRQGVKIGEIIRDIQVRVEACNNVPPVLTQVPNQIVNVGQQYCVTINATDADNDNITLTASSSVGTFVVLSSSPGAASGQFCFTPTAADQGQTFTISVQGLDNGCPAPAQGVTTFNITVPIPCNAIATATATDVLCAGVDNGTATVTTQNTTPPLQYTWSNGGSTPTITGLAPGTYTVTVVDGNSCVATASATVGGPTSSISLSSNVTGANCGQSNGSVTVTASGGTAPYSYSLNGGTPQASGTFSGLGAGTFTVDVVDNSGCTASTSVTITLANDVTAPVLSGVPANANASCDNVPGPATVTATDDCDGNVAVSFNETIQPGNCPNNYTIVRTWTATDVAGNTASATQTVTVSDNTPPVITCPANISQFNDPNQCGAVVNFSASATDNCGSATVSYSIAPGSFFNIGPVDVTATATDECGNTSSCTFEVFVYDHDNPAIQCPADVTVACFSDVPAIDANTVTATDNCPLTSVAHVIDTDNNGLGCPSNPLIISRTYRAQDSTGNFSDCVQTITVSDSIPPVITCPAPATVNCGDATDPSATGMATATDNCGGNSVSFNNVYGIADEAGNTFVNYCAFGPCQTTDPWGNVDLTIIGGNNFDVDIALNQFWRIRSIDYLVADVADFTVLNGIPQVGANWVNVPVNDTNAYSLSFAGPASVCAAMGMRLEIGLESFFGGINPASIRTVYVFDANFLNSQNPTGNQFLLGYCVPASAFGPPVAFTDNVVPGCGGTSTITRTFTAEDACGNGASCTQTINVVDNVPPTITCPPAVTVNCGDDVSTASTGDATATDACGGSGGADSLGLSYQLADATGSTIIDYCGFLPCQTQDPWGSLSLTGSGGIYDVNVAMGQFWFIQSVSFKLGATASDFNAASSGAPIVDGTWTTTTLPVPLPAFSTQINIPAGSCGIVGIELNIVRQDPFGGFDTQNPRTVYINDPNFASSQNPSGTPFLAGFCVGGGGASVPVTSSDVFTAACGQTGSIVRTFTATDDCGNSASCTQDITIVDNVPPTITCPPAVSVECGDATDPSATGLATATDDCNGGSGSGGSLSLNFGLADANANTIIDYCGFLPCQTQDPWGSLSVSGSGGTYNADVTMGQFWFIQSVSFKLGATPSDFNVANGVPIVDGSWQTASLPVPLPAFNTQFSVPTGACGIIGIQLTIVRQDPFGGFDTNNPRTVFVYDPNFASSQNPSGNQFLAGFCVQGGANPPAVTFNDSFSAACGQTGTITRTFTATDDCGNTASCTQDIVITDQTAPVVNCPSDITVNNDPGLCAANVSFAASGSDGCGDVTVTFDQGPGLFNVGTTPVTATATDDCGNTSTCSFNVTVNDNEAPVIVCPADTLLQCQLDTLQPDPSTASATDNCGVLGITFLGETNNGATGCGSDPLIFTRTYQATDVNGNASVCTQEISIVDTVAPVIVCPPDTTISCGVNTDPSVTGFATGFDNCELSFANNPGNATHPGGLPCGAVFRYKLIDAAGSLNTNLCAGCPTVAQPWGFAEVLNDSSDFILYVKVEQGWVVESVDFKIAGPGGVSAINGVPVVDPSWNNESYNIPERTALIKVPLNQIPANCNIVGVKANVGYFSFFMGVLPQSRTELYIYDPIGANSPNNPGSSLLTEYCPQACVQQNYPTVSFNDFTAAGSCQNEETITRTWSAFDYCQNFAFCTQTITIVDEGAPTVTCPANIVVDNDPGLCAAAVSYNPTAWDDCDMNPTVTTSIASGFTFQVGTTTVDVLATDDCGNSDSCSFTVTVNDTEAPNAVCNDVTVQLDASGVATITAADVDGGSTDNCGVDNISIDNSNFACSSIGGASSAPSAWINELHYDNASTDVGEAVEIAGTAGLDLTGWSVVFYNGSNGTVYRTESLSGVLANQNNGFGFTVVNLPSNGIQNGGPDGLALVDAMGNVVEFISYEGSFTGVGGAADGLLSVDIGVSENSGTPVGFSLQRAGTGSSAADFAFVAEDTATFGGANNAQNFVTALGNTVTLTVTDVNGNSSTCSANVTVEDNVAPNAVCNDLTVQLDVNGAATISATDVDGGSSDNCAIAMISIDQDTFDCSVAGGNTVTLTVTDVNGNSSTCTSNVTVEDNVPPTAICQDVTVQLDNSGNGSITASDIDNGSFDNCAVASIAVSDTDFDCSDVGSVGASSAWINEFHYDNASGDVGEFVEVAGTAGLDLTGWSLVFYNGSNGTAYRTESLSGTIANQSNGFGFVVVNLPTNGIQNGQPDGIALVDDNGNVVEFLSYEGSFVAVGGAADGQTSVDVGVAESGATPIGFSLQRTGTGSSASSFAFAAAAQETPGAVNTGQTLSSSSGGATVTLTVTDAAGNTSTCAATVTVEDNVAPNAVCQDITVQLDGSGNAGIIASDVDGGSTDNCAVDTISIDNGSFDCSNLGGNAVTLTVTDVNGNSSTCTATVTVEDNVDPTAVCQDITVQLDGSGQATISASDVDGGSTDNCAVDNLSVNPSSFDCSNVGPNNVTLTATDVSGNSGTCTAVVTVEDNIAPNAVCEDITVYLDNSGLVFVQASDIDGGSTDNCGIASISTNAFAYGCGSIGDNPAILTVTDVNGNVDTCNAIITVEDTIPPTVVCQDITVSLDANGQVSIDAPDITASVSDNCGSVICSFDTNAVSQTDFTCADIGTVTVVLTARDVNGNTDTCQAQVTVVDSIPPVAVCQDITIQLDGNGQASITPADVDGGSTDNCDVTVAISDSTFDCADVGSNSVVLIATDGSGNTDACTATVTVEDNEAPTAVCQDITVQLDGSGNASIVAADVDGGSADNCAVASISIDNASFDCSNVGPNTVTLTVTDVNGNSSTCTATVTVEDNVAPNAICQDVTVQLDANGAASIVAADVDGGSTDNCAVASISATPTTFDCSNLGMNAVTLTVTDVNGNSSTCTANVTVEDNIAPTAVCQDLTVYLDQNGQAGITAADVDNGSSDNCGIDAISVNPNSFDCADVGSNQVTLTVSDASGNSDVCTANVEVLDTIAPTAVCQDVTIALDSNGTVTVTAADIDGGSFDNCNFTLETCDDPDPCTNVDFNSLPGGGALAAGTNITTQLAGFGIASVSATGGINQAWIFDSSNPTGGDHDLGTPNQQFGGPGVGNSGSSNTTPLGNVLIVQENNNTPDDNAQGGTLDFTFTGATDVVDITLVDIEKNGGNVTLTTTSGNNVVVAIPPQGDNSVQVLPINVSNVLSMSVYIKGSGAVGGLNICSAASGPVCTSTFDCSNLGPNTVVLTATDASGNVDSCSATVTVTENNAPTAVCQDVTVQLDGNGQASITAADVDGGSFDDCGIDTITANPTTFDCADLGNNAVTLTVTDNSGNVGTCVANVTVEDNIAPTAVCQDLTVQLDATGNVGIAIDAVDNGSSDNCDIDTIFQDVCVWTCADIGVNTVTLFVTDGSGNTSTCTADVTVEDNIAPTAVCQDVTLQLDQNGFAVVNGSDVDGGSFDNCDFTLEVCEAPDACVDIDFNSLPNGQAIPAGTNITTQLAGFGISMVSASGGINQAWTFNSSSPTGGDFDLGTPNQQFGGPGVGNAGSSNNTALGNLLIIQENNNTPDDNWSGGDINFTFAGATEVVSVTLVDIEENGGSITLTTVGGNTTMVAIPATGNNSVQDLAINVSNVTSMNVHLDGSGAIGGLNICSGSNTSSGSCNNVFDCDDIGPNTVVLTVTDGSGNVDSCTATVTIEDDSYVAISCPSDIVASCNNGQAPTIHWDTPDADAFSSCEAGCSSDPHISGYHYLGEYNGHRYYKAYCAKQWDDASDDANAIGGYLAVINDAGENQFIKNNVGGNDYWIGLTDEVTEGTFEWVNNDPVSYTNWKSGEPNNAGGSGPADYAVIRGNNGKWYDRGGCSHYKYIVEVPCGPEVTVTQIAGPASGSTFQPGTTTTITYVASDSAGNSDTCSFTVTVDDCPPVYCHAQAQCSNYEWINNVSFETVNNTSGNDGGYGDYTNLSATVAGGSTMNISLSPAFSGQSYTEYWRVWVDWNRDGDFNDAGEMAFQGNGTGTVNGSISVPANAANGSLRMRVTMQWDQYAPNACCNFYYGEIEDYTLYVSGVARLAGGGAPAGAGAQAGGQEGVTTETSRVDGPPAGFEFGRVFPNPVARALGGKVQVDYRSGRDEDLQIRVMDMYGQVLYTKEVSAKLGVNHTELNVSDLPAGTYFIEVTNEAGKRTEKLVIQ